MISRVCSWARLFIEPKAKSLDPDLRHRRSVLGDHFSKVLREGIDLLLEEEKGGTDGTQLPFVNNKGESLHLNLSVANHVRPR